MKLLLTLALALCCSSWLVAQEGKPTAHPYFDAPLEQIKVEDAHGHLITDPVQKKRILDQRRQNARNTQTAAPALVLLPAPLCSNSGFEEYDTSGSTQIVKDFALAIGEVLNPMQCRDLNATSSMAINQYDPGNSNTMATTVPANHLDEYIGNIGAYDQFALKINHKNSSSTISQIQGKRTKTDNETQFKFNYKAVLQSIGDNGHDQEQPFVKARILRTNGSVVDEFCLIGTPTNCIFKQADALDEGAIILYTPNWQSGILDISGIQNNEEFLFEFVASRCGLGGHFGYAYIDDICLLHTDENVQGSITLDPQYKICPALPMEVCGDFTIPNSGGVSATVASIKLEVRNSSNAIVYTSSAPTTLDLASKRFCFELAAANFPDVANMGYNLSVTINYGLVQTSCSGTNFDTATDDDANPGWDIWFLNCTDCPISLHTASLSRCDPDHNGTETFDLNDLNSLVTASTTGLTFDYYLTLADATAATNVIATPQTFLSASRNLFVRVNESATCYKIIAVKVVVRNPAATISGILNVCVGNTILTASAGASYLWGNGATTQSIITSATGPHTVTVTDAFGCTATKTVVIPVSGIAPNPDLLIAQPSCFSSMGSITVTSVASQYSFDNGATWGSNATSPNLPVGDYNVKIRTASGCTSYAVLVKIKPFLSSRPDYTNTDPQFCGDTGSITITSTATEYSFDDGLTWGTQNSMQNLPSGTYRIRTKDTFGCISNYNSVILNGEFLVYATYIASNPYCGNPGSILITTPASAYSFDGGTTWQASNELTGLTAGSYLVKIRDAMGCTSPNGYVYLDDLQYTYPDYQTTTAGCDTYGSLTITTPGDFYSFDGGVSWQLSPVQANLGSPVSFNIRVKRGSCLSRTSNANFYGYFLPVPVATDYQGFICDNQNNLTEPVNLNDFSIGLTPSSTGMSFKFYTSLAGAQANGTQDLIGNAAAYVFNGEQKDVYACVIAANGCHGASKLSLYRIPTPVITMLDQHPLCVGKTVTIDAGLFHSYTWSNGATTSSIVIDTPGTYEVTVTEEHLTANGWLTCSATKQFVVFHSDKAVIRKIDAYDWTWYDNAITTYVDGIGDYEYSLDGIHFQDSPTFVHLDNGAYTVYIHDKHECGTVIRDVFLLMYPKYFTPNDDTYNDVWKINYAEFEPGMTTAIFDRDGKLLKVLQNHQGWDGKYHGRDMPANDYWFLVTRADGREHRGHFTLKR